MPSHSHPRKAVRKPRQESLIWPPLNIFRWVVAEGREQTLAAFESALQEGAEGIALDAHFPLLADVLSWVRAQKCLAFVILKSSTPGVEANLVREISRARVRGFVRVIPPDLPGLRRIRQLDTRIHLGLQIDGRPPAILQAKALGAEVVLPHWKTASPSFIRRAHRASLLVIPWTVDSTRDMQSAILQGADGIITNHPAKLTQTVLRLQLTAAHRSEQVAPAQ